MNPAAERLAWGREVLRLHCPHASGDRFADGLHGDNRLPLHRLFLVPHASPADGGRVEDVAARRSLPLTAGSVLWLPADRRYRFIFQPGLLLVGFHFRLEAVPGQDLLAGHLAWQAGAGRRDELAAAWRAAAGRSLADWLTLEGLLRTLLARHVDLPWTAVEGAVRAQRRWGASLAELERLGARRAVAACARRRGLTREGFSRAFRRELGVSPTAWLSRRLAERASEALLYSDRTCDDIATELGFADGFALSRMLKRVTGRRPGELRLRGAQARNSSTASPWRSTAGREAGPDSSPQ